MAHAILLISCPDKKGITAAVTNFIFQNGGNIVHADQHIDDQTNTFFMRIEWSLDGFQIEKDKILSTFDEITRLFDMTLELYFSDRINRLALFVSKPLHCLYDLLIRWKEGQLLCEIPLILSNHPDAQKVADNFDVPFHQFDVMPDNKEDAEQKQRALLTKQKIDFIVLARYHQILSPEFVAAYPDRIINIHHSFLPAFAGRSPYAQAYQKGVKIIGATSHFVTEKLDDGPIIEQDTVRISHRDSLEDLKRKGQDLEKIVLSRAVRLYLQRKILRYGNKTVIFD